MNLQASIQGCLVYLNRYEQHRAQFLPHPPLSCLRPAIRINRMGSLKVGPQGWSYRQPIFSSRGSVVCFVRDAWAMIRSAGRQITTVSHQSRQVQSQSRPCRNLFKLDESIMLVYDCIRFQRKGVTLTLQMNCHIIAPVRDVHLADPARFGCAAADDPPYSD